MGPDHINGAFVPQLKPHLSRVTVEGEAILLDESTGVLHRLSRTGTVLWECFDGATNLEQVAGQVGNLFGTSPNEVLADVVAFARTLGRKGLLEGVAGETSDEA